MFYYWREIFVAMEALFGLSLFSSLLLGLLVILLSFIFWVSKRQDYFKNHNIPFAKSPPLLGAFSDSVLGKLSFYDNVVTLCNRPELKDKPFFGMFLFHKPALVINDPELIKQILVKDFNSFTNRYTSSDTHDPLGYFMLFSVKNSLWKKLRGKLSPFFSSGKLKTMYYLLDKISTDLNKHIHIRLDKDNKVELEMKELAALYSTDVIASCAFGVEANSLENPDGEFRKAGKTIFEMTWWRSLELPAFFMMPQVMKFFGFQTFSKFGSEFIRGSITDVIDARVKNGNKRNDLIDTLIELKKSDDTLSDDMLIAQAAVFFTAGYETSSATQSFALYEMVKNNDIQQRLRNEIKDMLQRTGGKVTYDAVMSTDMPYLHQVVYETLRKYPIFAALDRECVNPAGYSLEPFSDFKIPYGMPIYIPIFAIQRDAKNFPDPLKFDPDRFSPENIGNIKPFTNFPFGVGPRNCVGERFGLMQVKTGIVKILKDFRLEPTANTPKEVTLEKKAMLIQPEKGLYLNLVKDPLY